MNRKIFYSLGLATVLGFATVLAIPTFAPDDACAGGGCAHTEQSPSQTVSSGSTCAQAESILYNQLASWAGCDGGFCEAMLVITDPCEMNDPSWYPVTGYLEFQCRIPSGPAQPPGGDPWGDGGGTGCTVVCRCGPGQGGGTQGLCDPGCRQVNCI